MVLGAIDRIDQIRDELWRYSCARAFRQLSPTQPDIALSLDLHLLSMIMGEYSRIAVCTAKQPQVQKQKLTNIDHAIPPAPMIDPWFDHAICNGNLLNVGWVAGSPTAVCKVITSCSGLIIAASLKP